MEKVWGLKAGWFVLGRRGTERCELSRGVFALNLAGRLPTRHNPSQASTDPCTHPHDTTAGIESYRHPPCTDTAAASSLSLVCRRSYHGWSSHLTANRLVTAHEP